ncbi:MAG: UDP-N-acetylmuramoyl-tripeptide--D-alanyl-D-alanine ligase [Anaerolineae bacterium]|nr:UDP-N-acetylmuramoyl-tripeptide--D-alanyl-D-alanine ligase [Anaerolineae bacterium]
MTNVGPVHLEKLGSIDNIALAKSELIEALPDTGVAILNDDDARVRKMLSVSRARVLSYGLTSRADVWAENIESHGLEGISLVLHHKREAQLVRVPLLGAHSAQTVLRAAAAGLAEGMQLGEIVEALMGQSNEQLRLVLAKGPFGSLVIDDTYNASAESTIAALNVLKDLDVSPRIAVLGDMLELGSAEQDEHEEVGCRAALVADYVVAVGQRAKWIAQSAIECGLDKSRVFVVANNAEALDVLSEIVTQRSAILVKGSRGMQMEEIVEGLGGTGY